MKKLSFFFLLIILLSSCTTNALLLPGEKAVSVQNIYNEYMNIGDAYFELEKFDKASKYYELALKNKNNYWTATYKLARSYAMMNNWPESLALYKKLLKRDPDNIALKLSAAYVYAMSGDYKSSLSVYEELYNSNSDDPEILVNYISLLFTMENFDKASEKLNELKEKFPENENIKKIEDKLTEQKSPDQ